MSIVAFIPAYNESGRILDTVEAAFEIEGVDDVVVIDDCSTDDTRSRALIAGATVIRLPEHSGKGAALTAGLADFKFDHCLFLDADLGKSASQGMLLLAPVLAGDLDMAIARFPKPPKKVGFGKVKAIALDAIKQVDPTFDCQSPLSGQRAMTRECINALLPLAEGFGVEVALTIKALRRGFRIAEVETNMSHAATGNDVHGMVHRAEQYKDVHKAIKDLGIRV
ncbi:MAG: glycosyltransferase family 2 protein [Coriobacteriales bacterium]|jgi:glycosyltransferase involved in cell wall biosynthesis